MHSVQSSRLKSSFLTGAALALGACSYIPGTDDNKIHKAEQMVAAEMKDPASAVFMDVRLNGDAEVCGFVNAKNSYGAYEGKRRFVVFGVEALLERDPKSDNPGIVADKACMFERLYGACAAGKSVSDVREAEYKDRQCSDAGKAAIKKWHDEEVFKLKQLGIR